MVDKGYRPQGKRLTGFEGFEEYDPPAQGRVPGFSDPYSMGGAYEDYAEGFKQIGRAGWETSMDVLNQINRWAQGGLGATVQGLDWILPDVVLDDTTKTFFKTYGINFENLRAGGIPEETLKDRDPAKPPNILDDISPHKITGAPGEKEAPYVHAWRETEGLAPWVKPAFEMGAEFGWGAASAMPKTAQAGLQTIKKIPEVAEEVVSITKNVLDDGVGTLSEMVPPPNANFFGILPFKSELNRKEQLANAFIDIIPERIRPISTGFFRKDEVGTRLGDEINRIQHNAASTASLYSGQVTAASKIFSFDEYGRIPRLRGIDPGIKSAPTIQDVAARYSVYESSLKPAEQLFFEDLRRRLAPISEQLKEMGIELEPRADVAEGGFYIPRGFITDGMPGDFDKPLKESRKPRKSAPGFTKEATYDSMGDSIASGRDYVSLGDALHFYITGSGKLVSEKWVSSILRNLKDADGNPILIDTAKLLNDSPEAAELIASVQRVRAATTAVAKKNQQLSDVNAINRYAAREHERRITTAEKRIEQARKNGEEIKHTAAEIADAAAEKAAEAAGAYTREDIRFASAYLTEAIADSRRLIERIKNQNRILKSVDGKLTKSQQKLEDLADEMAENNRQSENLMADLKNVKELFPGPMSAEVEKVIARNYDLLIRQEKKISIAIERAMKDVNKHEKRAETILEGIDALETLKATSKSDNKHAEYSLRVLQEQETLNKLAQREEFLLNRESRRAVRLADKITNRQVKDLQREVDDIIGDSIGLDDNAARALLESNQSAKELEKVRGIHEEAKAAYAGAKNKLKNKKTSGFQELSANLPDMNGYLFPKNLANALDVQIADDLPFLEKFLGKAGVAGEWINGIHRSFRATYDDSALFIHGLLRVYDNPQLAARGFKWHLGAWKKSGEDLLGAFTLDFDRKMAAAGRLTSEQWTSLGLHLGGESTEFMVGAQAGTSLLRKIPGIKESNRAFGFLGDRFRLEWADEWLASELRSGKTLDEIIESGMIREIAEGANRATGYSSGRFGGPVGDMLLFAPRFLQARFENIVNTTKSMQDPLGSIEAVPFAGRALREKLGQAGLTRDIPMDQRMARRSMLRFIGGASFLTWAINDAQGKETDWRVLIEDPVTGETHLNPNFMAVNMFGRDHFLMGTYHSLLRLMVLTGMGLDTAVRGQGPVEGAKEVAEGFRGLGSGVVQMTWDLLSGSDMMGENARGDWMPGESDALAKIAYIMESFRPISTEEIPTALEKIRKGMGPGGTAGDVGSGIANAIWEFEGGKSSSPSYRDIQRDIANENREKGIPSPSAFGDDPGWDPENLTVAELRMIRDDDRMKEYSKRFKARSKDELGQKFEILNTEMKDIEADLLRDLGGTLGSRNYKGVGPEGYTKALRDFLKSRAEISGKFQNENEELLAETRKEFEKGSIDYFASAYWDIELENPKLHVFDYDKRDDEREKVIQQAIAVFGKDKEEEIREYILAPSGGTSYNYRGKRFTDPRIRAAVEDYEATMDSLQFYYQIGDNYAKRTGSEEYWKAYKLETVDGWKLVENDVEERGPDSKHFDYYSAVQDVLSYQSAERALILDGKMDSRSSLKRSSIGIPPGMLGWEIEALLLKVGRRDSKDLQEGPFKREFNIAVRQKGAPLSPQEIQDLIDKKKRKDSGELPLKRNEHVDKYFPYVPGGQEGSP